MKKSSFSKYLMLIFNIIIISSSLINCKKTDSPIKFTHGTFPDSVINLADINSVYDDYNITLYQIEGHIPIIFSSNRKSSGGQ
jgi:hypothetical protein